LIAQFVEAMTKAFDLIEREVSPEKCLKVNLDGVVEEVPNRRVEAQSLVLTCQNVGSFSIAFCRVKQPQRVGPIFLSNTHARLRAVSPFSGGSCNGLAGQLERAKERRRYDEKRQLAGHAPLIPGAFCTLPPRW